LATASPSKFHRGTKNSNQISCSPHTIHSPYVQPTTDEKLTEGTSGDGREYRFPFPSSFLLPPFSLSLSLQSNIKLHSLYANVGTVTRSKTLSGCDSVLINKLRIGYCHLTHLYLPPILGRVPLFFVIDFPLNLTTRSGRRVLNASPTDLGGVRPLMVFGAV